MIKKKTYICTKEKFIKTLLSSFENEKIGDKFVRELKTKEELKLLAELQCESFFYWIVGISDTPQIEFAKEDFRKFYKLWILKALDGFYGIGDIAKISDNISKKYVDRFFEAYND